MEYDAFLKMADGLLDHLFHSREMTIRAYGEEEKKIDEYIIERSRYYKEKYANMGEVQLFVTALAEIAEQMKYEDWQELEKGAWGNE